MNENDLPPDDEQELLIAEYALGVLSAKERVEVQALLEQSPRHQALLAAWQHHFADWLKAVPAVEPSAGVWLAVQEQLFAAQDHIPPKPTGQWNNPRLWRWTTAVALAASLLLAVFVIQPPAPLAPPLLARLQQSDGNTLFTATLQPDGRHVLFVRTRNFDWQEKSAQAWIIGADGKPQSLGLLSASDAVVLEIPSQLSTALDRDSVLAVSLEPAKGSPTGLPTGPVIAQGKIVSL